MWVVHLCRPDKDPKSRAWAFLCLFPDGHLLTNSFPLQEILLSAKGLGSKQHHGKAEIKSDPISSRGKQRTFEGRKNLYLKQNKTKK